MNRIQFCVLCVLLSFIINIDLLAEEKTLKSNNLSDKAFLLSLDALSPDIELEGIWSSSIFDDNEEEIPIILSVTFKKEEYKIETDLFTEKDSEIKWNITGNYILGEIIEDKGSSNKDKTCILKRIFLELSDGRLKGWWIEKAFNFPYDWTKEEISRIAVTDEKEYIAFDKMP
ncbi:MAG: hypothetical protein KAI43_11740 [Candidatus Aureabacteria bacterium]|nr:hypothetical protein [Candidatus Auribacterota bacterium]